MKDDRGCDIKPPAPGGKSGRAGFSIEYDRGARSPNFLPVVLGFIGVGSVIFLLGFVLLWWLILVVMVWMVLGSSGSVARIAGLAVGTPLLVGLGFGLWILVRRRLTGRLPSREKQAHLTARRCPACSYGLEGIEPSPDRCTVCPECGAAWRLPSSDEG